MVIGAILAKSLISWQMCLGHVLVTLIEAGRPTLCGQSHSLAGNPRLYGEKKLNSSQHSSLPLPLIMDVISPASPSSCHSDNPIMMDWNLVL